MRGKSWERVGSIFCWLLYYHMDAWDALRGNRSLLVLEIKQMYSSEKQLYCKLMRHLEKQRGLHTIETHTETIQDKVNAINTHTKTIYNRINANETDREATRQITY